MDATRFDSLARSLRAGSRRGVIATILGAAVGIPGLTSVEAKKKKPCPPCKKRKQGKCKANLPDGTGCSGGTCQGGSCVAATPPPGGGCTPECAGKSCGAANGCGGTCATGACPSTQICVNGACQASCPTTLCNGNCVDTRTSSQHCGSCGNACTGGAICQGGQCQVPDDPLFCTSQADCGGSAGELTCDTSTRRCECASNPSHGICERFDNGAGLCGPCCAGATTAKPCAGELVCVGDRCSCPAHKPDYCTDKSGYCSMDTKTDPHRCGSNCEDCTLFDGHCCSGSCVRGCSPGWGGDCLFAPCGNTCTRCPAGQYCCNRGPGTPDKCVAASGSTCPLPGE